MKRNEWFKTAVARYSSRCPICYEMIKVGALIDYLEGIGWPHLNCRDKLTEEQYRKMLDDVTRNAADDCDRYYDPIFGEHIFDLED